MVYSRREKRERERERFASGRWFIHENPLPRCIDGPPGWVSSLSHSLSFTRSGELGINEQCEAILEESPLEWPATKVPGPPARAPTCFACPVHINHGLDIYIYIYKQSMDPHKSLENRSPVCVCVLMNNSIFTLQQSTKNTIARSIAIKMTFRRNKKKT